MFVFFKSEHQIRRCTGGGVSNYRGGYTDYTYSDYEPIELNIQPASKKDMDEMIEDSNGRSFSRSIVIFSDQKLRVAGEDEADGDWVKYEDDEYLIIQEAVHKNPYFPISYYKYFAVNCTVHGLINSEGGL